MKERQLYKEAVPIMIKLYINFQIRDLLRAEDALFEGHISELFNFASLSFRSPSASIICHVRTLHAVGFTAFEDELNVCQQPPLFLSCLKQS